MHLIVLIDTDAQNMLGPQREVAGERVRLVVEGIARSHTYPQLVLPRRNLHFRRRLVMHSAKNPEFLLRRTLKFPVEHGLIVDPNRHIALWELVF